MISQISYLITSYLDMYMNVCKYSSPSIMLAFADINKTLDKICNPNTNDGDSCSVTTLYSGDSVISAIRSLAQKMPFGFSLLLC